MTKWLICSGPDWYRASVTSTKQFARQFRNSGYHVLWINPIAFKSPFVNSTTRSSALSKIRNKLATHLRLLRREANDFWILVPFYLPSFGERGDRWNRGLVNLQVRIACMLLGIRIPEAILWISGSFTAESLLDWRFHRKIYQAADLISGFRNASPALKQKLEVRERNLCTKADTVFAASEKIAAKLREFIMDPEKVHLLHHGVDFRHFSATGALSESIRKIRSAGKPVAGYFGSLSDANDKAVFLALAERGFSVAIIGKVMGDYTDLLKNKDIHLLGPVPYQELPRYAAGFDVALLNWRMHEWIQNCFPVKSLEYLALGLPVVSCKIPVLMAHFPDEISFVETPEEFAQEARRLVESDSEALRQRRRQSVSGWSWESRFTYVQHVMENLN